MNNTLAIIFVFLCTLLAACSSDEINELDVQFTKTAADVNKHLGSTSADIDTPLAFLRSAYYIHDAEGVGGEKFLWQINRFEVPARGGLYVIHIPYSENFMFDGIEMFDDVKPYTGGEYPFNDPYILGLQDMAPTHSVSYADGILSDDSLGEIKSIQTIGDDHFGKGCIVVEVYVPMNLTKCVRAYQYKYRYLGTSDWEEMELTEQLGAITFIQTAD